MEAGMMAKNGDTSISGPYGTLTLDRSEQGVPGISAPDSASAYYGLGWVHCRDRQLQTMLTRILLSGRAAELLAADPALVEIDRFMRRMNFLPDTEEVLAKLEPDVRRDTEAYVRGYNDSFARHGRIFEWKLLGYRPEPWEIKDTLILGKIMAFLGLADAQAAMEKFIVQMVQNDVDEKKLRELFPYLSEKIDYRLLKEVRLSNPMVPEAIKWLSVVPRMRASNNWAVAGSRTASGKPIYCSDPHLEMNRIPAIWQEVVMRIGDESVIGATLPGTPGFAVGRTRNLAWGPTFSFMDMIDFRVEHCRDGKYRRGNRWLPFRVREEVIRVKKGAPVVEKVYENDLGVLEGDPFKEGHYLVLCWSAARGCGAGEFNGLFSLVKAKNVKEGMACIRKLEALTFNWTIADTAGNIGYQMSGRMYNRPRGTSGLVPLPAWEKKYDPRGFVDMKKLPARYNPAEGFIVTANQDLNRFGTSRPINLPMASYRADRIAMMIKEKKKLTVEDMKRIHFDLYSLQARRFMEVLAPLIPDTENGRILKKWDCTYSSDSKGAMLFESVYRELLLAVFGDNGLGRNVVTHVMEESGLFNDYYGNFDEILMRPRSAWFGGVPREELFRKAVNAGLAVGARPYGSTRKIVMTHLLLGGKFPRFLGFDRGPLELIGNRATVPQGQIFRSAGRVTTFSPSFRFITDMAFPEVHTNIAGGPSDRRFSRWYLSDLKNWLTGVYKVLK
jgi:penicillin G amidase